MGWLGKGIKYVCASVFGIKIFSFGNGASMMSSEDDNSQQKLNVVLVILLIAVMEIIFFGQLFISGNMIGNRGDARLNNLIMEHWYHVFCGKESINTLSMFYPVENTLSYTDMLLGFSIPYSILRVLGINMFVANKVVLIATHFFGSYCLLFLLIKIYKLQCPSAFIGVVTFSFANGYAVRIGHTQMMALSFVPFLLILLSLTVKEFENTKKRRNYFLFFITMYALLAYTGWYTFYFFSIFAMIFMVIEFIMFWRYKRGGIKEKWKLIQKFIPGLVGYMIYFVVLMIPFLYWYLPTSKMSGNRSWTEVVFYSPEIADVINVSSNNWFMGKFIEKLNFSGFRNKGEGELAAGFSIVLIALVIFYIYSLLKRWNEKKASGELDSKLIFLAGFSISLVFSVLLIVNSAGMSLWYFIYKLLPGAGSLRALSRWWFFLLLPIGILLSLLTDYNNDKHKVNKNYKLVYIAAALLWFSNIYAGNISNWNYKSEQEFILGIPAPPEGAKVIAWSDSGTDTQANWSQQLDAWMVADYYGIKTVNGYSGMAPLGFKLEDISSDEYFVNLLQWKIQHEINEDIYVYDRATTEWSILQQNNVKKGDTYVFSDDTWGSFIGDWHDCESWGRWTGRNFTIAISLDSKPQDLNVDFTAHSFWNEHGVKIYVGETEVANLQIGTSNAKYSFTIPKDLLYDTDVRLTFCLADEPIAPCTVNPDNGDKRELGIGMVDISIY